jgi:hypothetical protein
MPKAVKTYNQMLNILASEMEIEKEKRAKALETISREGHASWGPMTTFMNAEAYVGNYNVHQITDLCEKEVEAGNGDELIHDDIVNHILDQVLRGASSVSDNSSNQISNIQDQLRVEITTKLYKRMVLVGHRSGLLQKSRRD